MTGCERAGDDIPTSRPLGGHLHRSLTELVREEEGVRRMARGKKKEEEDCLLVGCLTSQLHANVS